MQIDRLSRMERVWVREAIRAVADGPFVFNEAELVTIIGFTRNELRFVHDSFETANDAEEKTTLAINARLNTLINYPHRKDHAWSEWLSIPRGELALIYEKWRRFRAAWEKRGHS